MSSLQSAPHISGVAAIAALSFGILAPAAALENQDVAPTEVSQGATLASHEIQTSNSGTTRFDNGQPITANAWIQTISKGGCGSFSTSAVMNVSPVWIRNTTSFYQIGLGSVSIKGVSIESSRAGGNTLVWTNNNGAKGSYLSGTASGGWGALYVGMDVSASALYNITGISEQQVLVSK